MLHVEILESLNIASKQIKDSFPDLKGVCILGVNSGKKKSSCFSDVLTFVGEYNMSRLDVFYSALRIAYLCIKTEKDLEFLKKLVDEAVISINESKLEEEDKDYINKQERDEFITSVSVCLPYTAKSNINLF